MIKKYNLDPSLQAWIMEQTGLGPGLGEVRYLCKVGSSTNKHHSWLRDNLKVPPHLIHFNLASAYNAMTDYRNDLILAMPGAYLESAELDWTKPNCHLLGCAGPNIMGDHSEPGVSIYTTGVGVVNTLHVTGQYAQFINVGIVNNGANAACLAAVYLDTYGTIWRNCGIMGNMNSTQNAVAAAASLYLHTSAHYPLFERCQIGSDVWGLRAAANSGQVYFSGSQPNGGLFRQTHFKSISNVATVAMITTLGSGTPIGRGWVWDQCHFGNFSSSGNVMMNNVFYGYGAGAWWELALRDCSAQGYDEWTDLDTDSRLQISMPGADLDGGLMQHPTAAIGD
ncbi:hypothetical protein LCGC14_2427250 [marine sediment metagenome]|uniref:Right handed beta helix domain-containing protein n=1 Tax=marine sediment metagenome TaxID=412755 RepID=A0A0F9CA85_9ZZZZ